MKHACISLLTLVTLAGACAAQNLVPNGSFEEYSVCPDNLGQATRADGWEQNTYTPDYFNACSDEPEVQVPFNNFGVLEAYDGSAYMGMIAFADSSHVPMPETFRERIGRYLSVPLVAGVVTHVSFRLGIAAFGPQPAQVKWTCKGFGAKFMMEPMDLWGPPPAPSNDAQVYLVEVPMLSETWVLVSGTFVPDSAYAYVVLGNFFSDSLSTPVLINPDGNYRVAYMYVDDVCVSQIAGTCDYTLRVEEQRLSEPFVSPNPCVDRFDLHLVYPNDQVRELVLMDQIGRIVARQYLHLGVTSLTVDMAALSDGLYWLSSASRIGFATVPIFKMNH